MKRLGVFLDVSNLYYCIQKKFPKRKLDYRKYKRFIEDLGEIQQAIAYGAQMSSQADGFIYCLQQMGFHTKFKAPKVYPGEGENVKRKADWDVGIAMDVVNMIDRFDMIILGTGDGDMLPLVEWCMRKGVDVVILATGISRDLKKQATKAIEIPESLLESKKPKGAVRPLELAEQKIRDGADPESLHTVSNSREDNSDNGSQEEVSEGIPASVDGLRRDDNSSVPSGNTSDSQDDSENLREDTDVPNSPSNTEV